MSPGDVAAIFDAVGNITVLGLALLIIYALVRGYLSTGLRLKDWQNLVEHERKQHTETQEVLKEMVADYGRLADILEKIQVAMEKEL